MLTFLKASCATVLALLALVALPSAAFAQASIAGVVRDASGAVLPGVTVEASSPALIEKTRSVLSDANGQYKIVDLRPGTYSVVFTLVGFNTFKRDGIELTGSFTATVNGDLRVGGIEETVTVSGESPIVDVQSATHERVLGKDVIDAIPTSNTHFSVATLIPAVQSSNTADVGGTNAISLVALTAHGGRNTDMRVLLDGLSTNNTEGAGQFSGYLPNMASVQELSVDFAAGVAEQGTGGVVLRVVPRDGGNRYRGSFFATGASQGMEASNLTADIIARNLTTSTNLQQVWDVSGGFGGPVIPDKIWFFFAARRERHNNFSGGYTNLNAGNPAAWDYVQGPTPTTNDGLQRSANLRLTWQATPRNKFAYFYDNQYRCLCKRNLTPLLTPEATSSIEYPYANITSFTWSSPLTNRLLVEAGFLWHPEEWHYPLHDLDMIGVQDQGLGNLTYRGQIMVNSNGQFPDAIENAFNYRASVTYVTGTHALKIGFMDQHGSRDISTVGNNFNLSYRFNSPSPSQPTPNQLTEYSTPNRLIENIKADLGIYAQDRWTINKLTANLGVRFDYFNDYFPPQSIGPSLYTPNRNLNFPETPWVSWKDITPRIGLVYDVFGNGKTAVRASINKYMLAYGLQGMFGDGSNPINLTSTSVTRNWDDKTFGAGDPRSGNFVPDCDLTSSLANGECKAMSSSLFGQSTPSASVDPDILQGWGKRGYNWEFSAGVQHQLAPRVSVDVGYFRRWYGNFIAIDNLNTTAADYTPFSITAPVDARLPNGGGYTVNGLYDVVPGKFSSINNYYTFASNYGEMYEHWSGMDVGVNTRFGRSVILSGGLSSGKTVANNCAVLAQAPEAITGTAATGTTTSVTLATTPVNIPYCRTDSGLLTQGRVSASYLVPKIDVQASLNYQNLPGPSITANYVASKAVSGGGNTVTVNLVAPGALYGDRVNQIDLRFSKALRYGQTRTALNVDIFNLLNTNPALTVNNTFSPSNTSWQSPLSILQSRFVKLGVQFEF